LKKSLLIYIFQNDYRNDQARLPIAKQQKSIINLIQKAKEQEVPIVYIRNEFERTQISNLFRKFTAIKGTEEAEFEWKESIFQKIKRMHLTFLTQQNMNELIVTDVFVEGCVSAKVYGALTRNFKVIVVNDAVGGASDKSKAASLMKLAKKEVLICKSQQILEGEEIGNDTFTAFN